MANPKHKAPTNTLPLTSAFILPENQIYMCGHSLGPMPRTTSQYINTTLADWGQGAVQSWNTAHWIDLPYTLGKKLAPLIGALPHEVIISDSTSVNLFKVLHSALQLNPERHIILAEKQNFPADLYIAQGIVAFNPAIHIQYTSTETLLDDLNQNIAVLILSHINYRDAYMHNISLITQRAHQLGIIVIWDLSHSIGAVPIDLSTADADFAVGCTYKYLSGGPGAPAFIYINQKHHATAQSPVYGWMGHQQPFAFLPNYQSAEGPAQYNTGTPYILSLRALESALDLFSIIDIIALRKTSLAYSDYLIHTLKKLEKSGLHCISPENPEHRGGHVAFIHPSGYAISRALIDAGIICDYREPGLIRLCVNPLYLSHDNIKTCANNIINIIKNKIYTQAKYQKIFKVT